MSKEIVKKEETLPALQFEADDFGAGFEDTDASSYAIPFLKQLQVMSGQCKRTDPAYVKGAEEGDFFNTVTEKLYKGEEGVIVIPCHYIHKYNEWAPDRGGFRGSHTVAEYASLRKHSENGTEINEDNGNTLQDTREHYVLIVNDNGDLEPALLCLTGTQLKKSKKWMTLMQGIRVSGQTAPMFSQKYKLTACSESNDKGSWAGIKIEHVGQVTSIEEYQNAKHFREMVRSGEAKAAPVDGEDIPF